MRTWVVVATAVRGALKVPEELDAEAQMDAWAAYRLDMTVPMERVTWRQMRRDDAKRCREERDRMLRREEEVALAKSVKSERFDIERQSAQPRRVR